MKVWLWWKWRPPLKWYVHAPEAASSGFSSIFVKTVIRLSISKMLLRIVIAWWRRGWRGCRCRVLGRYCWHSGSENAVSRVKALRVRRYRLLLFPFRHKESCRTWAFSSLDGKYKVNASGSSVTFCNRHQLLRRPSPRTASAIQTTSSTSEPVVAQDKGKGWLPVDTTSPSQTERLHGEGRRIRRQGRDANVFLLKPFQAAISGHHLRREDALDGASKPARGVGLGRQRPRKSRSRCRPSSGLDCCRASELSQSEL